MSVQTFVAIVDNDCIGGLMKKKMVFKGMWQGKTKLGEIVIGRIVDGSDIGMYGYLYIMPMKEDGRLGAPKKVIKSTIKRVKEVE